MGFLKWSFTFLDLFTLEVVAFIAMEDFRCVEGGKRREKWVVSEPEMTSFFQHIPRLKK